MGLVKWLKSPVLVAKYPCGVFLRKNGNLDELGHRRFIVLLEVRYCKEGLRLEETIGLNAAQEMRLEE